jgi:hypothetical protein
MKNSKKYFASFALAAILLSSISVFAQSPIRDWHDREFNGTDCCSGTGNCIVGDDFC